MHARFKSILLIAFMVAISGCSDQKETNPQPPSKTSVSFLHYFSGSLNSGFTDLASKYNESSQQYELKSVSLDHEAFKSSILETLRSTNSPDIYSYWAGARTGSIAEHLEPIDDLWQQSQLASKFSPTLIQAASEYQGKKYLLPLTQHYVGFFYNKALFSKLGLKEPTHWDEFVKLCETIKASGATPIALGAKDKWPAQFWFDYLLLRTAPYSVREDLMQGQIEYTHPAVTEAFQAWSTLLKQGYFNDHPESMAWDSGANELVFEGKAAMTLMGTWNIGYFTNEQHQWQPEVDFGFFPFPIMNDNIPTVALGPIDGLIIPKNASNKDGAKAVLAFLAGEEPQQLISQGSGALAPNIKLPDSFYNPSQLKALEAIENSQHFAFNYDLATPPEVANLGLDAFTEFLVFPDAYQDIQKQLATKARQTFQSK